METKNYDNKFDTNIVNVYSIKIRTHTHTHTHTHTQSMY